TGCRSARVFCPEDELKTKKDFMKKTLKLWRGSLLRSAFCFLISAFASASFAQTSGPTVSTDQPDYPPGSIVYITGAGFGANEIVTCQVLHIPDTGDNNTSTAHQPWTVVADDAGNFSTTWDVPFDQDELGATLQLTATGQTSGLTAQTTFSDSGDVQSVTLNGA